MIIFDIKKSINGLRNTVLGVMFAYLGCEGGGSFDFELCSPINSMNAL